jgi:hypothetical protein
MSGMLLCICDDVVLETAYEDQVIKRGYQVQGEATHAFPHLSI